MNSSDIVRDDTPTYLVNPLDETLVFRVLNDANEAVIYTIPPLEIMSYPKWLAEILRKHVIDAMINARKPKFASPELRAEYAIETQPEIL